MNEEYWAHEGQPLPTHLLGVAKRAEQLGKFFGADGQAWLAGLLHDLGKAEEEFQKRIKHESDRSKPDGTKEPHCHHGASLLLEPDAKRGGPVWPVAFAINGHHAGLHNRCDLQKAVKQRAKAEDAEKRLARSRHWPEVTWPVESFGKNLPQWLDALPFTTPVERAAKLRAADLYTRFLFSALVDADRLDTEENDSETKANFARRHNWRFGAGALAEAGAPESLLDMLTEAIQIRKARAKDANASEDVLRIRSEVLDACAAAAPKPRGVFSLTVPTGGGKTLASLFFALKHIAAQNAKEPNPYKKLRRVIVVIPYLSIIHQTVRELVDVFQHSEQDPIVLEHHSQAQDPPVDEKKVEQGKAADYSRERTMRQLAAENWEAPIVVTTSVQFFDSLFSRRPADARKLHNIAQSVVIFDEVQTFPPRLMQPILDALGELTRPFPERPYGCSLVLCTATQPALLKSEDLPCGFAGVTEIIPKPQEMFTTLKRTTYPELEADKAIPRLEWPELAAQVFKARNQQALLVVNTRRHARALFEELRKSEPRREAVFHLSTWMTPAHRVEVLNEVARRLGTRHHEDEARCEPCFLVSTQCIEAGVDVDFPAVWRALGPYDAIVQAAGRCNRNGRLSPDEAPVHVFRTQDDKLPPGIYQTATNQTELLRKMGAANPHDPASFETYFRLLYQLSVPEECEIQREREKLHFEQVHKRFNFIESCTVPIVVAEYELKNGRIALCQMCEQAARRGFLTPAEWRQVQPHIVQLDYHDKKTAKFDQSATAKMFRDDDDLTGLRRLTHFSAYKGDLHGCGLDVDMVGSFETVL